MKDFKFIVHKDAIDVGVVIRGVRISGIDNHSYPDSLNDYIRVHTDRLLENTDNDVIKNDRILNGFIELHKNVGIPKRKNPSAGENLLRALVRKQSFHRINPVVDIYNIISMESRLALGAHDIDKVDGNIHLRLTDGSENYVPLGQEDSKPVKAGVYSYIDDANDIVCYLEIRQVMKTLVDENSTDLYFIVQGNQETSQSEVDQIAKELIIVVTYYLGGKGELL